MNGPATMLCTVYRSSREKDIYVYVERSTGLDRVPQSLLDRLGSTTEVLTLKLDPERKLARARAVDVLAAIATQGYYLQLPPDKSATVFTLGG